MSSPPRLHLASRSPRRRELLDQIGVAFSVVAVSVPETRRDYEGPREYVERVALAKARAGREALSPGAVGPVLGADTEVVLDDDVLGKPRDADDAAAILGRLSGRSHRVLSAVALIADDGPHTALNESRVWFRVLEPQEIAAYVATREPLDKAGAYAIQGLGAIFVTRLEGSYSGVMGLPLAETAELLRAAGVPVPG